MSDVRPARAAVVGSGFGGLAAAIRLDPGLINRAIIGDQPLHTTIPTPGHRTEIDRLCRGIDGEG